MSSLPHLPQLESFSDASLMAAALTVMFMSMSLPSSGSEDPTLSPPLSTRISRASSGVAISSPSPSMIWRALVTCAAFDSASLPGPIQSESSRPTRTLPPIAAAIAAICIWLRPAPSTDQ